MNEFDDLIKPQPATVHTGLRQRGQHIAPDTRVTAAEWVTYLVLGVWGFALGLVVVGMAVL